MRPGYKVTSTRNTSGLTLPFALILTFIFTSLVGVAYLFVSINLSQMQSSLWSIQAIMLAEGINEKIKARLNTKSKINLSPEQEEKLKGFEDDEFDDDEDDTSEDDLLAEDDFNEQTEEFDEYYADEVVKISRFITFRDPPQPDEETGATPEEAQKPELRPEANVEMIGSIEIPRGVVLNKGIMIAVYKDEKISLKLNDIVQDKAKEYKSKLPLPVIKALTPNYSEAGTKSGFSVQGDNLSLKNKPRFTNKEIYIEDVKAGPYIEFLTGKELMPGLTMFYLDNAQAEFYIIPTYDGSTRPIINNVINIDGSQLLEAKAGQRHLVIMIQGIDLYLKKTRPIVIPDGAGIIPEVKDLADSGKEITVSLNIEKKVEPGVHSLTVATEGGLSNTWLFSVIPPDETKQDLSANTATVTSSLTLLDIRVVENLLPLIDEKENIEPVKKDDKSQDPAKVASTDHGQNEDSDLEDEEISESEKLGPFANTDLETVWLIETSAMVGRITKTISEIIQRQAPNVHGALITNGSIVFEGGGYMVIGETTAMTTIIEPTYVSNTILQVQGPPEEPEVPLELPQEEKNIPKSPIELGFLPGSFAAVYKEGGAINDLDYAVITMVGRNTIEISEPGLMDFHYEGDNVFQFVPPVISKEKLSEEEAEKHVVPKELAINLPNVANAISIFRSNLDQYTDLADLYTNDITVQMDEFDLPLGYMGLTYIEGTPTFDSSNLLSGKGLLVIDTRSDNQGRPQGDVEINGDSKSPADFTGVIYVHGNLKITGNTNINGALIIDNDQNGHIDISSNAVGKITYDPRAIKQTLVYLPFTTKPGTVMISNKPINLEGVILSGSEEVKLGVSPQVPETSGGETKQIEGTKGPELPPEEALVEVEKRPSVETIIPSGSKPAEEELIDLF